MEILSGLDSLGKLPAGAALSVGNYDGVHLGHQHIVRTMRARTAGVSPGAQCDDAAIIVITFEPHPLSVLRPDLSPPRLTPGPMKQELLEQAGVTHLLELEPTQDVLNLTAEQFWERLRDEARPVHLVEGPDFNFGKGARGNVSHLRQWTQGSSVHFTVIEPHEVTLPGLHIVPVSSSLVRWLVANGRVSDAAACLGRPYTLRGTVVEGYRRGASMGFPTANLDVSEQMIPADGIYAGRAQVDGTSYRAAVSIGSAPTFAGARRQVEAHLLNFSGDLYGRTMDLALTGWVRDQMRFPSVDRLVERMHADIATIGTGNGQG